MKVLGRWMPTLGLAACLAATGCKKEEAPPPPASKATRPEEPKKLEQKEEAAAQPEEPKKPEWTAGLVDVKHSSPRPVTLREVRTARNEGFDRLVLQFDGDQLPSYHLEYIDKPVIKCGSGEPTEIAGQGWLRVRLQPAQAHEGGQVTVAERERKPGLPIFQELELTCDFEGEVTWVLGVKHPNEYRVMELSGPTRLVVDVRH